jgi:protein tyrosine phosphatase (PTP) superfamily phosphohydrolase (DUF442 family)
MDREEIIRMAREAGFRDTTTPVVALGVSWEQVQRFAALVAAAEREACAKLCDHWPYGRDDLWSLGQAIRARGNT